MTSPRYWAEQGRDYIEHGWPIIPIRPGQKRPAGSDWQNTQIDLPTWQRMAANGSGECGIGILTGRVVGIDVDCSAPEAARSIYNWCCEHVGPPLVRYGRKPRMMLVYRTDQPATKRRSAVYLGPGGERFAIEVLGLGQQFVAAGVHPDTGQPYEWRGPSPADTPFDQVPVLSADVVPALFDHWSGFASGAHWDRVGEAADGSGARGAQAWERSRPTVGMPLEQAREVLQHAAVDWGAYEDWLQAGQALHHEFGGDELALDLWDDLSAVAENYQVGVCSAKWRTFNDVGASGTITMRSFIHRAQAQGYVWHCRSKVDALEVPSAITSIERWLTTEPPPIEWLIPDLLPKNTTGGLIAPGGTGKSFFALQLAYAVATGTQLCGYWPAGDPTPVLALMAEEDEANLHRRLRPISKAMAPFLDVNRGTDEITALAAWNLDVHPRFGKNNLLTEKLGHMVTPTALLDNVIKRAQHIGAGLVIIDPAMQFRGGDENSQEDVGRFVQALIQIQAATGATVLVAHHANKSRDPMDQGKSRGASAFTDGLRWQANMATLDPADARKFGVPANEAGMYVAIGVPKNNYCPPMPMTWLHRGQFGVLSQVDLRPVAETKEVGRSGVSVGEAQQRILAIVRGERKRGERITVKQLREQYGGTANTLGIPERGVREVVADMINRGLLREVPGANNTKTLEAVDRPG